MATDRSAARNPKESFMLSSFFCPAISALEFRLEDAAMVARGGAVGAAARASGLQCGASNFERRIATLAVAVLDAGGMGIGSRALPRRVAEQPQPQAAIP